MEKLQDKINKVRHVVVEEKLTWSDIFLNKTSKAN